MPNKKKIFVSYTFRDGKVTKHKLLSLKMQQSLDVDMFVDALDNDSDEATSQNRVVSELFWADEFLIVKSPSYNSSPWTHKEVELANQWGKHISITTSEEIKDVDMDNVKHRVFISYHHANDQWAKERLIHLNKIFDIFIDESVHMDDIDDTNLTDQDIRKIIRDQYLKKSTVTILLVGVETQYRKHVDWELYSSMYDGPLNQKSGIIVIMLPSTGCTHCYAAHENEKFNIFETYTDWNQVETKEQVNQNYPYLPSRIAVNLLTGQSKITIVNWTDLTPAKLRILIDNAYNDKNKCTYIFPPMRRKNFNPDNAH